MNIPIILHSAQQACLAKQRIHIDGAGVRIVSPSWMQSIRSLGNRPLVRILLQAPQSMQHLAGGSLRAGGTVDCAEARRFRFPGQSAPRRSSPPGPSGGRMQSPRPA